MNEATTHLSFCCHSDVSLQAFPSASLADFSPNKLDQWFFLVILKKGLFYFVQHLADRDNLHVECSSQDTPCTTRHVRDRVGRIG
jgi:hypothetical protein